MAESRRKPRKLNVDFSVKSDNDDGENAHASDFIDDDVDSEEFDEDDEQDEYEDRFKDDDDDDNDDEDEYDDEADVNSYYEDESENVDADDMSIGEACDTEDDEAVAPPIHMYERQNELHTGETVLHLQSRLTKFERARAIALRAEHLQQFTRLNGVLDVKYLPQLKVGSTEMLIEVARGEMNRGTMPFVVYRRPTAPKAKCKPIPIPIEDLQPPLR
ncbi:hypothetical protein HvAV-3i_gp102 [Heliothis virescens ascovirus 3i]|nr:hypothetical protein HvAV-3i_gp102 [Heliothis virescens ascovirus 3i]